MHYYNISELKDIVSNISAVPHELGVHIFSFIQGDYEKENHKYLRMQSKNKRTHRIHNKITNRIRNLIKYENNSNACKNCTKQIMLGKWNYKDIPEAGHIANSSSNCSQRQRTLQMAPQIVPRGRNHCK